MKTEKTLAILFVASFFLTGISFAAEAGTAFTYQGHLYDNDVVANGEYDFMFKVYDDPNLVIANQIGSPLVIRDVAVFDGNFTVELDFGTNVFTGDERWLLLLIRPGDVVGVYTELDPLQKLTAVPYALHALNTYTGLFPINVDKANMTIGLNPATYPGDLMTWNGNSWISTRPGNLNTGMSNMQPYLGINYIIALQGTFPSRNSTQPFIAEIIMFAGNFPPRGWAYCDGQLLSIASNTALFSLIGTIYGGDGRTTFALPDLRGRVPVHPGHGPGLTTRKLGEKGGSQTVIR